jgi:endonuclease/exonuclease/phosphatase family metal-dependent hydrolase
MASGSIRFVAGLTGLAAGGFLLSRHVNYHPRQIEPEQAHTIGSAPCLRPGQRIKAVTFNVQFLAGTGYHFFYDGGPDTLVARSDIDSTAGRIGEFIANLNADLVLLQEVDCGARRTAYVDELALLLDAFPSELRNHASTYYWKSRFVPHPKILGSAGTKLAIFSRYRLGKARRYRLPGAPGNPIVRDFNLKRAILELELPLATGDCFTVLNTHLEAFPKSTNVMERQIQTLLQRLSALDQERKPWILGGDFNLLPPGQLSRLSPEARGIHREPSEIGPLFARYAGVPPVADATGDQMERCFTFTRPFYRAAHSDLSVRAGSLCHLAERTPIRTLDFFFAPSTVVIERYTVQQKSMLTVSDHLPLIAEFALPAAG